MILCKENRVSRTYWGGHRIDRLRGKALPDGLQPEEWVASVTEARNAGSTDPHEGLSKTADGKILRDVLKEHPEYLGFYHNLPILLKLLDASERLVIQAHPTVSFAKRYLNSEFGKAECWYIISADPGAHVYLGFRKGVTRAVWIDAFKKQDTARMLSMLHRINVKDGDVIYVDGGVPHAIGGGCLMAELQEPTDLMVVTERVTPGGRRIAEERLHCGLGFDRMFDVFDYTGYSEEELRQRFIRHPAIQENARNSVIGNDLTDRFSLDEYCVTRRTPIVTAGKPAVIMVLGGIGTLTDSDGTIEVHAGDGLFLPATSRKPEADGNMRFLVALPN